jgi:lipopolysaccharide export system permease protein
MFFLVMPSVVAIYIIIDAFEKLGRFMEARVPFSTALLYFIYSSPAVIFELAPLAILISGLLGALVLARNRELLAIKSIGASPVRIIAPFISSALVTALVITLLNVFVFPDMTRKADRIFQVEIEKNPPRGMMVGNRLYYRGKNTILSAVVDAVDASRLSAFDWLRFSPGYRMEEMVTAETAEYQEGKGWILRNGVACVFSPEFVSTPFREGSFAFSETPEDFVALRLPPSEAGVPELWSMISRLRAAGLPCYRQEALFWAKLLYCFIGVSLLVFFMPLILFRISGSPVTGLVTGALAGFAMWFVWSLGVTLGATGQIPPASAPVGLNLLMVTGGYVVYRAVLVR